MRGNVYSIISSEYNSKKKSLPTGIYKVSQGNYNEYKNVVHPYAEYNLKRRKGTIKTEHVN